jgi:MFS transporter, DHA1 family, tetracycline resistance protein
MLISVAALAQFLAAPAVGALSDAIGRRPVLLVSLLANGADFVIVAVARDVWWLLAGRLIAGLVGATMVAANAYVADISTDENRARNFGLIGAAAGVGFILGPAAGGLLGSLNARLPFVVAAVLVLANVIYGALIVRESLPHHLRRPMTWAKLNPVAALPLLRRYPLVLGLAVGLFLVSLADRSLEAVWVLFTSARFGWDTVANGLTLALIGVFMAAVQAWLVSPVVRWMGERGTVVVGLTIACLAYVLFGLAWQGWMLVVVLAVWSLGMVAYPALQSLVAGAASPSEQGAIQGAVQSLMNLAAIVAPPAGTAVFAYFISERAPVALPGATFFAGALLVAAGLAVIARTLYGGRPAEQQARRPATE